MIAWLALGAVWAGDGDTDTRPYIEPRLSFRYVGVNGVWFGQASGGLEAGLWSRQGKSPAFVIHPRVLALGIVGLSTFDLGADLRAGVFAGPDYGWLRLQVGPDLWFNGYAEPGAEDYWLPWSPGIDIPASAYFRVAKPFGLLAGVTPGWAFDPDRQGPNLWIFDDFSVLAAAVLNLDGGAQLTVGWQRTWNAAGVTDGLVLGGSL